VKTVEIHRKRMMEKLEAGSIATLVANYAPLLPPSADAPTPR
jgi:FixJ family two-component response regulator